MDIPSALRASAQNKSFRARPIEIHRSLNVYRSSDIEDLIDGSQQQINRQIPLCPTGMEKEEEEERHLIEALRTQQSIGTTGDKLIPIPKVKYASDYKELYGVPPNRPDKYIRFHPYGFNSTSTGNDDISYDCDSEDEKWLASKKPCIDKLVFEKMMFTLEKNCGSKIMQLSDACHYLKQFEKPLIQEVFDYWLKRRITQKGPLMHIIPQDNREGVAAHDPYVGFRKRIERMQTRKNRKNDEAHYEKMVKLKRDFSKLKELMEKLKERELTKNKLIEVNTQILMKRWRLRDFDDIMLSEATALRLRDARPAFMDKSEWFAKLEEQKAAALLAEKLQHETFKHQDTSQKIKAHRSAQKAARSRMPQQQSEDKVPSSQLKRSHPVASPREIFEERFNFVRMHKAKYSKAEPLIPSSDPDDSPPHESPFASSRLTSLSLPHHRCIGFGSRRFGRGGRIFIDRATSRRSLQDDPHRCCESSLDDCFYCTEKPSLSMFRQTLPPTPPPSDTSGSPSHGAHPPVSFQSSVTTTSLSLKKPSSTTSSSTALVASVTAAYSPIVTTTAVSTTLVSMSSQRLLSQLTSASDRTTTSPSMRFNQSSTPSVQLPPSPSLLRSSLVSRPSTPTPQNPSTSQPSAVSSSYSTPQHTHQVSSIT